MPQPATHKGTVIMADMSVFQLGPHGLGIVSPYAPGPAAEFFGEELLVSGKGR